MMRSFLFAGFFLLILSLLSSLPLDAGTMEIYCSEVGLNGAGFYRQGDSTLIIGPTGTRLLIDGGAAGDSGANTVLALFSRIGLSGLDYMVTTHWDADHHGGMDDIATYNSNQYMPTAVYDVGGSSGDSGYDTAFSGIRSTPSVGDTIDLGGGATATFVCVNGNIYGGGYVDPNGQDNAESIGLLIQYGGFDYLTLGDLTGYGDSTHPDVEGPLAAALQSAGYQIDILHVSHHGSRYSTLNGFCADILAEYAVISCGIGQTFGHPHQYVINHLNALTDGGSAYSPSYAAVSTIYILEDPGNGTAGNVTTVGSGSDYTASQQGSLKISVTSDGVGASFSFTNEGPNTNTVSDGPYNSDEGGIVNGVVLNEIMPNPATDYYTTTGSGSTSDTYNEYIEIYNAGASPADVSGWRIKKDGVLSATIDSTSATQSVPAGGHILIVRNDTYAEQGNPNVTGSRSAYTGSWQALGNSGGYTISLHNSSDVQQDSVSVPAQTYASDRPYYRNPDGGGWTYASSSSEKSPTGYSTVPTATPSPTATLPPSYLLNEDFETSLPPSGWTFGGDASDWNTSSSNYRSPTHCVRMNAAGDILRTPLLTTPGTLTFWYRGTSSSLTVEYASSPSGPWYDIPGSPFAANDPIAQETSDLSSYSNIYLRFSRTSGYHYVDDVVVTDGGGGGSPTSTPTPTYTPTNTPTPTPTYTPTPTPTPTWTTGPGSDLINEDFEGSFPPSGWTQSGCDLNTTSGNYHSPTNCVRINANGDYLITPLLTTPDTLTFWYRGTSGALSVERASSVSGPWSDVSGSPFAGNDPIAQETSDLSSYSNIYLRFSRVPSAGYHYLDDVIVTDAGGASPTATPTPTPTGGPLTVRINYQPQTAALPSVEYLMDWGQAYGAEGDASYDFGWR